MKIHNTNREYEIVKKEVNNKTKVIGTITAFALLITLASTNKNINNNNKTSGKGPIINEEYFHYYKAQYYDALKSLNVEDFDKEFESVYNLNKIIIDNIEYKLIEIYLVKMKDGNAHLIKEIGKDLLTEEDYTGPKMKTIPFRNSSIFYELYKNGILKIENDEIIIGKEELKETIKNWDGLEQTEIMELKADAIASEKYRMKYGR